MTNTHRGDIETVATGAWTPADFAALPLNDYTALQKRWSWFQDQKIGVLVHWGLYSQAGIVESWQLSDADGWARRPKAWRPNMTQLKHDYWQLADHFAPTRYDPTHWARLFRQAGLRYAIFTTKHHDGYTLYTTNASDYHTTTDLFAPFAQAMRAAGIGVGAYYSKADWHQPDYWRPNGQPKHRGADYAPSNNPARWQRYVDFVHQQLTEIATQYGPLRMLWLDAGWVGNAREPLNFDRLLPALQHQQPEMLLVNRTMGGRCEEYVTPERQVPTLTQRPTLPWESNLPLANNWGYAPYDHYKPFGQLLSDVLQVITLGGNIVLGVGPKADGTLPAPAVQRLKQLGGWLALNGAGIYGTRPVCPVVMQAAQQRHLAITQDDHAYYIFFKRRVPDRQLDLKSLHLPLSITQVTRLGLTAAPLPLANQIIQLPGTLRQSRCPGLRLTKLERS